MMTGGTAAAAPAEPQFPNRLATRVVGAVATVGDARDPIAEGEVDSDDE